MQINVVTNKTHAICDTLEKLLDLMSHVDYSDFTALKSPLEVFLTHSGSCHDQVMFELEQLYEMGYSAKAKFMIGIDENGHGLETHSFVYFEHEGRWYWFENAWKDMQGIHVYDSYNDMLDDIIHSFSKRIRYNRLRISNFNPKDHTIGESLETLVDICMNS